jgi:septum formation protein
MQRLHIPFTCDSPDIDERPQPGELPAPLALRLAEAKARAVAARLAPDDGPAVIIGSDQVAQCRGALIGKPGDADRAAAQLQQVSGQRMAFHTAVFVLELESGRCQRHVDRTTVRFRHLDAATIKRYLASESALDCAGSFKSEGLGIALLEQFETGDPSALIGLPLIWLCQALRVTGVSVPA